MRWNDVGTKNLASSVFLGNSDSWQSTGLYLLEAQNAEVSLSEVAASAGLKVRLQHLQQHLCKTQRYFILIHRRIPTCNKAAGSIRKNTSS